MSPQAGLLLQDQIIPRLKSCVPQSVLCVGSEDPAELVQDSIAFSCKLLHNAEVAGKSVVQSAGRRGAGKVKTVSAGNISFYTLQHMKSGRRSTGSSSADVYGSQTQLRGRTRLTSLEEIAAGSDEAGEEIFLFHDVLSNDGEDPGTKAARKLDWQEFVSALPERERRMVEFIIEGKTLRSLGHLLHLDDRIMHTSKKNLATKVLQFMGDDILVDVRRLPRWKQDLETIRQKMACREERKH